MPQTFTDEMVRRRAREVRLPGADTLPIEQVREAVAEHTEVFFNDYVEGWEVRTGRPWSDMTRAEAEELVRKHPKLMRNPGILSKLCQ